MNGDIFGGSHGLVRGQRALEGRCGSTGADVASAIFGRHDGGMWSARALIGDISFWFSL